MRDEAKHFLEEILANGPVPSTEVEDAAEANGISRSTLFRAKKALGVVIKKDGEEGKWRWRLPAPVI